jgi:hypothetical protein
MFVQPSLKCRSIDEDPTTNAKQAVAKAVRLGIKNPPSNGGFRKRRIVFG